VRPGSRRGRSGSDEHNKQPPAQSPPYALAIRGTLHLIAHQSWQQSEPKDARQGEERGGIAFPRLRLARGRIIPLPGLRGWGVRAIFLTTESSTLVWGDRQ
jgi:hypothetical protein